MAREMDLEPRAAQLRGGVHAVVDVGSTKITCLIGRADPDGAVRIMGCGWQRSLGVRSGSIVDLGEAEKAIRAAVGQAESLADTRLKSVSVNLSCGQPESHLFNVRLPIAGRVITDGDIRRALDEGRMRAQTDGRNVVHVLPLGFTTDGTAGVEDPRGHHCDQLTTRVHVVDATAVSLKNLSSTLSRCDLDIMELVATPMASALSVLVDDERELGSMVIDMGGGTTSLAVYGDRQLLFTAQVLLGGLHVTRDIAGMMSTPVGNAERLKVIYGNAGSSPDDERELITVQQIGDNDHAFERMPRSKIVAAIRPRLEETFELIRDKFENAGLGRSVAARVVLTGGGSQMDGVGPLAARILARPVRLGRPMKVRGLPNHASGPGFSAAVGLLLWTCGVGRTMAMDGAVKARNPRYMGRVIEFLKGRA